MDIIRKCPFTGTQYKWDIPVTRMQLQAWQEGSLIQSVMPDLSPEQREFIMTGITPAVWDDTFEKAV